jgi:hypothetical protein
MVVSFRTACVSACLPSCQPEPLGRAHPLSCCTAAWRAQELELNQYGRATLIAQALAQPSMPRLRSLKLRLLYSDGGGPGDDPFAPLWAAPWFSRLQELGVMAMAGFGRAGLAPLRAAPLLRKLSLDTFGGARAFSAADGRALAAAALPGLRELQLRDVGPGLVAALATAPWLAGLEALEMSSGGAMGSVGGLAAAAGRALAAAPLASLKRLVIRNVEPGFVAACAAAPWLARLSHLDLRSEGDPLGGGGGPNSPPYLAHVPFTALVALFLANDGVAPPFKASRFAALVAVPWFGCLQSLELCNCPLGTHAGSDGAGLRALAAAPLPNLASLMLNSACMSPADVSGVLSSAPWLATLTRLELFSNQLDAPGHRALSLLHLPRLRCVYLSNNGFDRMGLAALVSAPWLTQLAELTLDEDFASPRSCEDIRRAIDDDAWVFGRLRRLGCDVAFRLTPFDPSGDDEQGGG